MSADDDFDHEAAHHLHEIAAELHSPYCPTCGQRTLLGIAPEWLLIDFGNTVFGRILAALIEARREHRTLSLTDICRYVYQDNPDGPPINAPNVIAQMLAKHRHELIPKGWIIVGPPTTGNGYALAPFERVADLDQ